MKLYLIRHARPEPTGDDPSLSDFGKAQAKKLGDLLVRLNVQPSTVRILASQLQRAQQTAKSIRKTLNVSPGALTTFPPPTAEPVGVNVERLMLLLRTVATQPVDLNSLTRARPQQIIVIWHFPFVGKALNWLVGNDLLEWPDAYGATAHVECLETFAPGSGKLRWFILPEMLP